MIDLDTLRLIVSLDEETGTLTWRERPEWMFSGAGKLSQEQNCNLWNKRYAGKPALSCDDGRGYGAGYVLGFKMRSHRVVWALFNGRWPLGVIDHINGDRSDNRPCNLRETDNSGNARNHVVRRDSKTGFSGVSYNKRDRVFTARASRNGSEVHVGNFKCATAAALARDAFYRKSGCQFVRYNFPCGFEDRP